MDNWQALMSPDCTHPSSELYKNKAQATFAVLEKASVRNWPLIKKICKRLIKPQWLNKAYRRNRSDLL